jgi:hypothetical protein
LLDTLDEDEQNELRRLLKKFLAQFETADSDGHGVANDTKKADA